MSLKTKLAALFGQSNATSHLGIAFRKDALSYVVHTKDAPMELNQIPVQNNHYAQVLSSLPQSALINTKVSLVLGAHQYQMVQVDKPNIPDDELLAALKWQVKDLITIEPTDLIVDYFTGPVLAGGMEKINVICAKKSELASYVEFFDDAGAKLDSIITEEFAFAHLIEISEQPKLLLCQQANEEVLILIVKDGNIYFNRRLRGFAQLGNKSPEELDFGAIDSLSLEIQRSMDYFERQLKQPPIKEVNLVLPIKTEQYLANKLAENTTAQVNVLPIDSVIGNKAYAAAYGAGMGKVAS